MNNEIYVVEPCMIGDSATIEDAEFVANYLTDHGFEAKASATEGARNEVECPDRLWDDACNACAEAHGWGCEKKQYVIEYASGAAVELGHYNSADWNPTFDEFDRIEDARRCMADKLLSRIEREDRGDDYENGWRTAANEAMQADVREVCRFDELGFRIVEA